MARADLQVVLEAVNNASAQLQAVRKDLEGLAKEAENTAKSTNAMGGAFNLALNAISAYAGTRGLSFIINQTTEAGLAVERIKLRLGGLSDEMRNRLVPQLLSIGTEFQKAGLASDEFSAEVTAKMLPIFKNDLPKAVQGARTMLQLMKLNIPGVETALRFLGEDTEITQMAMMRLAKAVGIQVNPKMDDFGEILDRIRERLRDLKLPAWVEQTTRLFGNLGDIAEKVGPKILKPLNALVEAFNKILEIPVVGKAVGWIAAFGSIGLAGLGLANIIRTVLWPVLAGLGAFLLAHPLIAGAAIIVAGLIFIGKNFDILKDNIKFFWNEAKRFLENFVSGAKDVLFNKIPFFIGWLTGKLVAFALIDLPNIVKNILAWMALLPERIWAFISSIPDLFYRAFILASNAVANIMAGMAAIIWNFIRDIPERISSAIKSGLNFVIGRVNSFVAGFNAAVPGTKLDIRPIPQLAEGGLVKRPTLAMLGERGEEAVIPLPRLGLAGAGGVIVDMRGSLFLSESVAVEIGDKIIDRLRKVVRIPSRSF